MFSMFRNWIQRIGQKVLFKIYPQLENLKGSQYCWSFIENVERNVAKGKNVLVAGPAHINNSTIGDYTYIAQNSYITKTTIGKFCSIGPNLVCGWGTHPTHGISTHPMFYSTKKQNGMTLSQIDKIDELEPITIGNDVFIGANVTILNGVNIGDGAVIGAGAVVSKDIPPYAIAVGCPIQINKYRFETEVIVQMQQLQWWNFDEEKLQTVENYFFKIDQFIALNQHD